MTTPSARTSAVAAATSRNPVRSEGVADGDSGGHDIFGKNVFSVGEMRRRLPPDIIERFQQTVDQGGRLDPELAEGIASAVLRWALERGVSHFCHWFHPMTGLTAEKHDAFLNFDGAQPVSQLTGAMLVQGEPDASSFPSGGMRTTFEARGYTAWDPTSPMFIAERTNGATLCIPSVFISYTGAALDKKTPLLRSMDALSRSSVQLLRRMGDETTQRVAATAGPEQEFFLVDRAYSALRTDLTIVGRTLTGAPAPKGQQLDDHYFGAIPTRVLAFLNDLERELYKIGVPAKTRHNEVAPSQFEIACIYREANLACDHNQLLMDLIERVARRHHFTALLHEKPFAGVNGSGKHLNWSLSTDGGSNLLEPGKAPHENVRFLAFLAATLLGVHRHAAVLRASIASHGNDFRLGANEAPPAIMSVFLGAQLTSIADALADGRTLKGEGEAPDIELGVASLPSVSRDNTDRNRTSPFAFTGNKFEFRALGSSCTVSWPATVLNTAVADGIERLCAYIDEAGEGEGAVLRAVGRAMRETAAVRFEGNNYAEDWVAEALRRGLPHAPNTPAALASLDTVATRELFSTHGVLTPDELESRYLVKVEQYLTAVEIEADLLASLVDQQVVPAAVAERTAAAQDFLAVHQANEAGLGLDITSAKDRLQTLSGHISALQTARERLDVLRAEGHSLPLAERAAQAGAEIMPALAEIRSSCDALESVISDSRWPLPRYVEMLFLND